MYDTSYPKRRRFGLRAKDIMVLKKIKRRMKLWAAVRNYSIANGDVRMALICEYNKRRMKRKLIRRGCVPLHVWTTARKRKSLLRRKRLFTAYTDDEIETLFGFKSAHQLTELKNQFEFPDDIVLDSHHRFTGEEALMIGLYRLRHPEPLPMLEREFGRDSSTISRCFQFFLSFFIDNWSYLLMNNMHASVNDIPFFAEAIRRKAEAKIQEKMNDNNIHLLTVEEDNENGFKVFAFIDCTPVRSDRPGGGPVHPGGLGAQRHDPLEQRAFYSGHKSIMALRCKPQLCPMA